MPSASEKPRGLYHHTEVGINPVIVPGRGDATVLGVI